MKKSILLIVSLTVLSLTAFTQQRDTLSKEQSQEILKLVLDSAKMIKSYANNACDCLGKIKTLKKSQQEISQLISKCIEKEVEGYQLIDKMTSSLTGGSNNIMINNDKNSLGYQQYYQRLENWMIDSCAVLRSLANSNEKQNKNSVSDKKKAQGYYTSGQDYASKENYPKAIEMYLKALEIDDQFAFAWDDLGVAYRMNGEYERAIDAYKKSLSIDPKGITPLHNIPVIYEYQKKYDKALESYLDLEKQDPKDAEGFYGAARMYIMLEKNESALRDMCMAYNLYADAKSPYRTDAEKNINYLFGKMKEQGQEKLFNDILKEYKLISN